MKLLLGFILVCGTMGLGWVSVSQQPLAKWWVVASLTLAEIVLHH
jgi:hypothetical protein